VALPPERWLAPEELLRVGFDRSRVVMVNEAHDGWRRSVRTREIGLRILTTADACGAKHLALEALSRELAAQANETRELPLSSGYLGQPEMRALIGAALTLGWTLHAYEAEMEQRPAAVEPSSMEATNWRDDEQARNLAAVIDSLPSTAKLMVWCGNSHLSKRDSREWHPMGVRFREHTGFEHFAIDQTNYVVFGRGPRPWGERWIAAYGAEISRRGGAAGFLAEEAPPDWQRSGEDAYVLAELDELR
jgi:Erythromycin esterase